MLRGRLGLPRLGLGAGWLCRRCRDRRCVGDPLLLLSGPGLSGLLLLLLSGPRLLLLWRGFRRLLLLSRTRIHWDREPNRLPLGRPRCIAVDGRLADAFSLSGVHAKSLSSPSNPPSSSPKSPAVSQPCCRSLTSATLCRSDPASRSMSLIPASRAMLLSDALPLPACGRLS